MARDIVELKNNNGTVVFPKTAIDAIYMEDGRTLKEYLEDFLNELKSDIIPATTDIRKIGTTEKRVKEVVTKKLVVEEISAANATVNATGGSLSIASITATGNITGATVYGAVFN